MQFLVFIRTEFGERHWKGEANSLQEAEEQAIASIDAHNKTISDTSLRCNWHWQNNSGYGDTVPLEQKTGLSIITLIIQIDSKAETLVFSLSNYLVT